MNPSSDKVLRYLGGNENIEDISINELQKLADENPYFSVAHFLLAKKLKAEKAAGFLPQVQKTALYFSNTYWLHYQLSKEALQEVLRNENNFVGQKIGNAPSNGVPRLSENKEPSIISDKFSLNGLQAENEAGDEKVQQTNEDVAGAPREKTVDALHTISSDADKPLAGENIEKASQQEEEMAALIPEPDTGTELFLDQLDTVVLESISNENENVLLEGNTPAQQETAEVLEEMAGVTRETDEATEAFLNETQPAPEEDTEAYLYETPIPPFTSAALGENKKDENAEPDEHELMFQNIKAMLDATSEEAEADIENAVIPIDPYYTIDYFASQGIKLELELEQNPKDQLGQHLKKFTHWLKHMKKLGQEDAAEVIQRTDNDADIQKIAESSNTVREVVTEAMASVLEKQGKNSKAIELYKKLSFLNPDKSAYFASKIKNLKGI